jgi:hypothetical protein
MKLQQKYSGVSLLQNSPEPRWTSTTNEVKGVIGQIKLRNVPIKPCPK